MEPNQINIQKPARSAKDFFVNLGAIVALYTLVISLINLLFTVINYAYPQTTSYNYYYQSSSTISWPVATLIIFFPIFILLMWLMEKDYSVEPARREMGIHKWLTYITLFISGLVIAGDLITVLYSFLNGNDLTTAFILKVLVVLVVGVSVFFYYISDVRGKLTHKNRATWRIVSGVVILLAIVWGFVELGSPMTQRLFKYDEQRVTDLQNLNNYVLNYYQNHSGLPGSLSDITSDNSYSVLPFDPETKKPYEYVLVGQSAKAYQLCADFSKATQNSGATVPTPMDPYRITSWNHPAGHYCFSLSVNPAQYPGVKLPM